MFQGHESHAAWDSAGIGHARHHVALATTAPAPSGIDLRVTSGTLAAAAVAPWFGAKQEASD